MIPDNTLLKMAIYLTTTSGIFFLTALAFRVYKLLISRRHQRLSRHAITLLSQAIITHCESIEDSNTVRLLKKASAIPSMKHILVRELFHSGFILQAKDLVSARRIYQQLGLATFSLRRLKQGNIKNKIRAIRELSQLKAPNAIDQIRPYTTSRNKTLKVEALLAMINLSPDRIQLPDDHSLEITDWQAIRLYQEFRKLPPSLIPDFGVWLSLSSPSIVRFALKMTKAFAQWQHLGKVVALRSSANRAIRLTAENVLNELKFSSFRSRQPQHFSTGQGPLKTTA